MLMENDISLLKETEIFKNLAPEQIRKVLRICRTVTFAENEIIMKEGEMGDRMYIILQGTVEVIKKLIMEGMDDEDTAGKNKVFTRLDAGRHAVFGEIALLEEFQRTATVRTVTGCTFYEIKKDDFLELADKDFELGYRILLNLSRIVSARLRKADEDTIKLTTVLSMILKET
jgi:CRP/FNR family cyclic AMP-dependent transcriptional regulator